MDPAKYDLFDCKQLEATRKSLASQSAELEGLIAKAETGAGGVRGSRNGYRLELAKVRHRPIWRKKSGSATNVLLALNPRLRRLQCRACRPEQNKGRLAEQARRYRPQINSFPM